MMNRNVAVFWAKRAFLLVIALMLFTGVLSASAAADDLLKPPDVTSSDGNITLHKQAERIGPEEWEVNVWAEVAEKAVSSPELEVAFLLDRTASMNSCTDEEAHAAALANYYQYKAVWHLQNGHNETNCFCDNIFHRPHSAECCIVDVVHRDSGGCMLMGTTKFDVPITENRLFVALEAIKTLDESLPECTKRMYYSFAGDYGNDLNFISDTISTDSTGPEKFYVRGTLAGSGTKIKDGVERFFALDPIHRFDDNSKRQKILILVTDGLSNDGYPVDVINGFKDQGGIVYTVGFNCDDGSLKQLASNDCYIYAKDAESLKRGFENITKTIHSMVIDPMGPDVKFDISGSAPTQGQIFTEGDTIYWIPTSAENEKLVGKVVEYSYTVKLNEQAEREEKIHNTALNNPTSFRFSVETNNVKETHIEAFPIPEATYAYSSIQVKWVDENGDALIAPTEVEKIVSDYKNTINDGRHQVYIPKYNTDYKTITDKIEIPGGNGAYYQYVKSTYKANNTTLTGAGDVNPENPVAHEVVHHYVRVDPFEETEATIVKVWDDDDNRDGKRPASLTVMLSDGTEVELSESNSWTATVYELPKYDDGKAIVYTWTEDETSLTEGYSLTNTEKSGTVTTLTNSYTPEETEATIVKVWDDEENRDGKRPTSLTVTLSDGTEVELSEANSWTATVKNLPKYDDGVAIVYNWAEANVPEGYTLTSNSTVGTVTTLTNSYSVEGPGKTEVTVEKVWIGKNGGEIKLALYANGEIMKPQPVAVRAGNKYTYSDLPTLDAKGHAIIYFVREAAMEGYDTTYENAVPNAGRTDCAFDGGKIINRELTDFSVRKIWTGLAEGEKAPKIELTLYCNGTATEVSTPSPVADGWYVYKNLPAVVDGIEAVYYVIETPVDGFITTYYNGSESEIDTECAYNGGAIENARIPHTGDDTPVTLWIVLAAASAAMLLALWKRRLA